MFFLFFFFFSSRRRHTRYWRDWSSDVCSSDLHLPAPPGGAGEGRFPAHVDERRGWQVGDRPRLEHPEVVVGVRPLYVLRAVEVAFYAKAYLGQPRELRIVER